MQGSLVCLNDRSTICLLTQLFAKRQTQATTIQKEILGFEKSMKYKKSRIWIGRSVHLAHDCLCKSADDAVVRDLSNPNYFLAIKRLLPVKSYPAKPLPFFKLK